MKRYLILIVFLFSTGLIILAQNQNFKKDSTNNKKEKAKVQTWQPNRNILNFQHKILLSFEFKY
jgi:hypothetical protein